MTAAGSTTGTVEQASRSPLSSSLRNASVLLIGASSGIGLGAARLLLEVGARPTLVGRDAERLAAAAASLGNPDGVATQVADVLDRSALDEVFARFDDAPLDHVLVTVGGLAWGPVATTPADAVRVGVEEKIWLGYEVALRGAPRMRDDGSFTFTSGPSAVKGMPGLTVSSSYNAGMEAFTRSLAAELAPRLRANCLRPGQTDTAFLHGFAGSSDPEVMRSIAAPMPLQRVGTPEEVAAGALFAMANPFVTGAVIAVDGGLTL